MTGPEGVLQFQGDIARLAHGRDLNLGFLFDSFRTPAEPGAVAGLEGVLQCQEDLARLAQGRDLPLRFF